MIRFLTITTSFSGNPHWSMKRWLIPQLVWWRWPRWRCIMESGVCIIILYITWFPIFGRENFASSRCLSTRMISGWRPSNAVFYACTKNGTLFRIFHSCASVNPSVFPWVSLLIVIFVECDICWRCSIFYDKVVWCGSLKVNILVCGLAGWKWYCRTQCMLYVLYKLSSSIIILVSFSQSVCEGSVTTDQIFTFFNIYRQKTYINPLPSSTE